MGWMPADLRDLFEFGPFTLDAEDGALTRGGEVIPAAAGGGRVNRSRGKPRKGARVVTKSSAGYGTHRSAGAASTTRSSQIRLALAPDGGELVRTFAARVSIHRHRPRVKRQNRRSRTAWRLFCLEATSARSRRRSHNPDRGGSSRSLSPCLAMTSLAAVAAVRSTAPESLRIIESKVLTYDGPPTLGHPVLTDGRRIYYTRMEDFRYLTIPFSGGDSTPVFDSASEFRLLDPGSGSDYLAIKLDETGSAGEIWVIPTGSGVPHRVGTLAGRYAVWSPDRRRIALVTESAQFKLADADGGNWPTFRYLARAISVIRDGHLTARG